MPSVWEAENWRPTLHLGISELRGLKGKYECAHRLLPHSSEWKLSWKKVSRFVNAHSWCLGNLESMLTFSIAGNDRLWVDQSDGRVKSLGMINVMGLNRWE